MQTPRITTRLLLSLALGVIFQGLPGLQGAGRESGLRQELGRLFHHWQEVPL
jgi:hypothetical protein